VIRAAVVAAACLILPCAALAQAVPLAVTDAAARAATKPIRAKKIILVGDSTMQVHSGWGGAFCADHLVSGVACIDLARGGRSSFSYRAEGSWDIARAEMKSGRYQQVYVLIQFGHNDQPGKPGRSTDLAIEFPANMTRYVAEARTAGAIPVLVTPLTRRSFKDGALEDDLAPWADAVRQVAAQTHTPLVDLYASSSQAVRDMGPVASTGLAELPPPDGLLDQIRAGRSPSSKDWPAPPKPVLTGAAQGTIDLAFDYTHLGPKGAALFSAQVAEALAQAVPDLAPDIIP